MSSCPAGALCRWAPGASNIRVIDQRAGQACGGGTGEATVSEVQLDFNVTGPAGAVGPTGGAGPHQVIAGWSQITNTSFTPTTLLPAP